MDGTNPTADNGPALALGFGLGIPLIFVILGLAWAIAYWQGKSAAEKPSLELVAQPTAVHSVSATSASAESTTAKESGGDSKV